MYIYRRVVSLLLEMEMNVLALCGYQIQKTSIRISELLLVITKTGKNKKVATMRLLRTYNYFVT